MSFEQSDLTLEQEVRDMIFERLHIDYLDKEEVDYEAPIFTSFDVEGKGLGLDSVDALELVVALRNNYGIEVSDEGMEIFNTIKTIADCIRDKKCEK